MKLSYISAASILISSSLPMMHAIPTWELFTSRNNVGQIVPGSTVIHVISPSVSNRGLSRSFLRTSEKPGVEGNATIASWRHPLGPPSRFFISKGDLHQITNDTHILYAELVNVTTEWALLDNNPKSVARPVFKLRFSNQKSNLIGGSWEWSGSLLHFRLDDRTNFGLYYRCIERSGYVNIYVPLDSGSKTPHGCDIMMLQSHVALAQRRYLDEL